MVARITFRPGLEDRLRHHRKVQQAVRDVAEDIQTEAARTSAVEAVDTGLYAASWRATDLPGGAVRVHNTARDPESAFNYPVVLEHGYRHRSGRHMRGLRILGRAAAPHRH